MQHSNRLAIRKALRVFAFEWVAVALIVPAVVFGFAHLLHVPPVTIWNDVIARPRNLGFVLITVLFAGRTWFAYKFEGQAETVAWDRLLETFRNRGAAVALLIPGSPPLLRIEGHWRSLQVSPLESGDVKAMAAEILRPKPEAEADGYAYSDFWYGDVAFYRAMAFGYPETTLLVVSPTAQTRPPPADPRFPNAGA